MLKKPSNSAEWHATCTMKANTEQEVRPVSQKNTIWAPGVMYEVFKEILHLQTICG